MKDQCTCPAPIVRGVNPEYCGNCGKDLKPNDMQTESDLYATGLAASFSLQQLIELKETAISGGDDINNVVVLHVLDKAIVLKEKQIQNHPRQA